MELNLMEILSQLRAQNLGYDDLVWYNIQILVGCRDFVDECSTQHFSNRWRYRAS